MSGTLGSDLIARIRAWLAANPMPPYLWAVLLGGAAVLLWLLARD